MSESPYVVKAQGRGAYREEFDSLQEAAEQYHQLRSNDKFEKVSIGNWDPTDTDN